MKATTLLLGGGVLALGALAALLVIGVGDESTEPAPAPAAPVAGPAVEEDPPRPTPAPPVRPVPTPRPAPRATPAPDPPAAERPATPPVPANPELARPIDERRAKLGREALKKQRQLYRDRLAVLAEQIRTEKENVRRLQQSGNASPEALRQAQRRVQQMIDVEPRLRERLKELEAGLAAEEKEKPEK